MRRRFQAVGVAVPAVFILAALWYFHARYSTLTVESVANGRGYRLVAARSSGSLAHRPLSRQRSASPPNNDWRLAALSASSNDLHEAGRAHLLDGHPDRAIANFEKVLRAETSEEDATRGLAESKNADLLTDLSAAYYTDATERGHAYALLASIESAERALDLDPESRAALWNRALALDALGAYDDARASWDTYLQRDPSSDWSAEARERRAGLQQQRDEALWPAASAALTEAAHRNDQAEMRRIVARFPMRSVALVERQLLPANDLLTARPVSEAITAVLHDPLLEEVTHDPRPQIAALYQPPADAATARDAAARLRSPAAIRLTLDLAVRRYEARDHESALAELDAIPESLLQRYPISRAQANWYRGLAEASLGYATDALASYGAAASVYESIGDAGLVGAMNLMRADAAEYAGDNDQAWTSYVAAMREIDRHGNATMLDNATFAAARFALRRGYPKTALVLQSRYVQRLRSASRPAYLCQALIARCDSYARLGRGEPAERDCREAVALFRGLNDAAARGRLEADLHIASAAAAASSQQSVEPLTAALRVAVAGGDHFRITRLYLTRARALLADRRETEAENDLRSAAAEIEEQRRKLSSDDFRVTWLDASRSVHEELVALLLRTNRISEAFEAADQARARVALDHAGVDGSASVVPRLRERLSNDAAFVELWTSSNDEVVAWVVTRETTLCRRFSMHGLARRVRSSLEGYELLQAKDETPVVDDLVRPWKRDVQGRQVVLISADGPLAEVPFAAALIAEHTVIMQPSAAFFIAVKPSLPAWTSALLVAGQSPAGQAPLMTEKEMASVRQSGFRVSEFVGRDEATPARFLELSPKFDVVHFAGHAVETAGQRAALVMRPDEQHPDGLLPSSEIEQARTRHGSLVVLAACRTARGRIGSDGARSLARSFLITGSTAVVGSLWNVDDESTGLLFARFYHYLAAHLSPAAALRLAQIDLSRSRPDPRFWAAFQIYGGAF